MNETIFEYGKEIIAKLREYHFTAYFVGGCIRDLLLERPVNDIDIVTEATPEDIMNIFSHTIPIGIEHGTVIVRHRQYSFEVTTFRAKNNDTLSEDERFDAKLRNDLKLRDFTINAIAMKEDGTLIDPFHGQKHLKQGVIKAVHDAKSRLKEDPLRILRAYRFTSELGFSIEAKTFDAMKNINPQLTNVAIERVNQEFTKLLLGQHVQKAFTYLIKGDTFNYLPLLKYHTNLFVKLRDRIQPLNSLSQFIALLHFLDEQLTIKAFAKEWKCSRKDIREAKALYNALRAYEQEGLNRWLIYQLGQQRLKMFLQLYHIIFNDDLMTYDDIRTIFNSLPITSKRDLKISGHDLQKLFPQKKPGQWIKRSLSEIEQKVVEGQLKNHFSEIKEWVLCHPPDDD